MPVHRASRGLRLPLQGEPEQVVDRRATTGRVALLAADYVGLRPTMHVAVGDDVRRGQLLFEDKKTPGVRFTAPADGRVAAVNRGERRAFESLVIDLSTAERAGRADHVRFSAFDGRHPSALSGEAVRELLLESGLWTALRARPFSRVADPAAAPRSIFVTAMESDPLAPDVEVVLRGREADFERGVIALTRLTAGPVFVCTADRFSLTIPADDRVRHERFRGPHPAGTAGFHIHTLDPAGRGRTIWYVGYQDVVAMGRLFESGTLDVERIVALAGPAVLRPRLLQTRIGSDTAGLADGEVVDGDLRIVSGSPLSGRVAMGPVHGFLGRYHRQVAVLREGRTREFMGWAGPGFDRFSTVGVFLSRLLPGRRFAMTTSTQGSPRAIVPIGVYEKVMPFDLEPNYLLKALLTHDVERAEQLGCLELDEEDVAVCTFVCPGKNDYGPALREVLTVIEKEG
jgi:Na+-transporting NADH:ubiquinone oxidoreductase subunit A